MIHTVNYIKHVAKTAVSYTFSRMTFWLTIFNFCMLSNWMYEQTSLGDMMKEWGLRPGDALALVIGIIFAVSLLEYVALGREKGEETQEETE